MPTINFITPDGEQHAISGTTSNIMELAVANNITGIEGRCGGVCSCATCHVWVAEGDFAKTGGPNAAEADMLEFDDKTKPNSRLSCQIELTEDVDGVTLMVAQ